MSLALYISFSCTKWLTAAKLGEKHNGDVIHVLKFEWPVAAIR